ncbi:universal stress protein [Streptomyces sp. NPDC060064]|uniref:universal stress protein n=1 Tax=Streptomyces sp. NPDC060064 TaxID=3347049 RepID=UPI0036D183C4
MVGVDGSPSSKAALRWAVKPAQSSGGPVDAVIAWEVPAFYGVVTPPMVADFEATARDVLTQAVKDTLADKPEGIEVRERVMVCNTAQVIATVQGRPADPGRELDATSGPHGPGKSTQSVRPVPRAST